MSTEGQITNNTEVQITNKSVDICFFNSLQSVKKSYKISIIVSSIHCLAALTIILLNKFVFQKTSSQIFQYFIIAACTAFLSTSFKLFHLVSQLSNRFRVMAIAKKLDHIVYEQPESDNLNHQHKSNILVSSKIYNTRNNSQNGQVSNIKKQAQEQTLKDMIQTEALQRDKLTLFFIKIISCLYIYLLIYGIILLCTIKLEAYEIIIMIIFMIPGFIMEIALILYLIVLVLAPLILIFACFYICCCMGGGGGDKRARLPQHTEATMEIIQKSHGKPCAICFQKIKLGQNVVVLPCSDEHVFHHHCITLHCAARPKCPTCKKKLSR